MDNQLEVRYSDWGLGNNFGDYIVLNSNLKKYPSLHQSILDHELSHTNIKGFTKKDLVIDIGESNVSNWELLKFMIKHPKSLVQLFPIYKNEKTIFYDVNMLLVWSVGVLIMGGAITYILL